MKPAEIDPPEGSTTLSIGELAEATGVSRDTLRYYEKEGLVPHPERSARGGHRMYDQRHIGWIRFLRRLRSTGPSRAA